MDGAAVRHPGLGARGASRECVVISAIVPMVEGTLDASEAGALQMFEGWAPHPVFPTTRSDTARRG